MKARALAAPPGGRRGGWRAHVALLALCSGAVILLHLPLLRLPYYWDEAGYYIPAARDFYQTGDPIPHSTLSNPHPPLLSIYLAAAWKLFGASPLATRLAMALLAGASLYALLLLGLALRVAPEAALWAMALTALTPVFFAQSTLTHLDVPATLGTLLVLYFFLRERLSACLLAGVSLCLVRETGAVLLLTLATLELKCRHHRQALLLVLPLIPLAAWFVFLRWRTGLWLGDSDFAAYNFWNVLHPLRWALQFVKRFYQAALANFHWVATALILAAARRGLFSDGQEKGGAAPGSLKAAAWRTLAVVIAVHLGFVSIFGGAALARYLLPIFPLFFLLTADAAFRLRWKSSKVLLLSLPLAFVACWFWNPPYPFAYEENLAYADFVRLHCGAAAMLEEFPASTRILTAWPATDELSRPWLGYVRKPLTIVAVADFSQEELERIGPEQFDVLLVFSRQWHTEWFQRLPRLGALQTRFFGYRPQVTAEWIRQRFGLGWQRRTELRGQWVEIWVKSPIPERPTPPTPNKIERKPSAIVSVRDMHV